MIADPIDAKHPPSNVRELYWHLLRVPQRSNQTACTKKVTANLNELTIHNNAPTKPILWQRSMNRTSSAGCREAAYRPAIVGYSTPPQEEKEIPNRWRNSVDHYQESPEDEHRSSR